MQRIFSPSPCFLVLGDRQTENNQSQPDTRGIAVGTSLTRRVTTAWHELARESMGETRDASSLPTFRSTLSYWETPRSFSSLSNRFDSSITLLFRFSISVSNLPTNSELLVEPVDDCRLEGAVLLDSSLPPNLTAAWRTQFYNQVSSLQFCE